MKTTITLLLLGIFIRVSAQNSCQPPVYYFDSMSVVSGSGGIGSVYRFTGVLNGIDALVTITGAQNASINNANVDNSSPYPIAWQPFITFPSSRSGSGDSSYMEFEVKFVVGGNGAPVLQNCMATTIVDCDGNGSGNGFREMVKVSVPGVPKGISNSSITVFQDSQWILFKSGVSQFTSIDTFNSAAMGQVNFPQNTSTFRMRVGVTGAHAANLQRQFSFYFRSFAALSVSLPVDLVSFYAEKSPSGNRIIWSSSQETSFSHYELHTSVNGVNFAPVARLEGKNRSSMLNTYIYEDNNHYQGVVYYRLLMTDLDGKQYWSERIATNAGTDNQVLQQIYPNPTNSFVHVSGSEPESVYSVYVQDMFGKIIAEGVRANEMNWTADLGQLPSGVYTLMIGTAEGKFQPYRIIKQ